jgi:AbrB family looped-hinge helix DNA binding protein
MRTVTVSARFQVLIPLECRRRLNLRPGTQLQVVEFNGGLCLLPVRPPSALRGIARGIETQVEREPD